MEDRDAYSESATETQDHNQFGDGFDAFKNQQNGNNGRRSTIFGPHKDSTTRSGQDPFNGNKDEDETYTESKGVIPPDIEVSKSSYEDKEESSEASYVRNNKVYRDEIQARNRLTP
jgi:hypothetical protein